MRFASSLIANKQAVDEVMSRATVGICHSDFQLANLAMSDYTPECQLYTFDWKFLNHGSISTDVAWFMLSSLSAEERREREFDMLRAYQSGTSSPSPNVQSDPVLREHLRAGMFSTLMFGFTVFSNIRLAVINVKSRYCASRIT